MENECVYENFIAWMRNTWIGLPDSEALLPTVRACYSEEEAALLTGMPFSPKSLAELSNQKGIKPAALAEKLDVLAKKGLVFRARKGGDLQYGLNDAFFVFLRSSFWPGGTDERSRRMAPAVNTYFRTRLFDAYEGVKTRGLRAIPVETSVDVGVGKTVLPHESAAAVLDEQKEFCVAVCPCRHRKNLDPDAPDCTHSTENCLHFGSLARYMVENGLGRSISREDARDILKQAAEEGLVHAVSNWQKGIDTICNCCKCCCMWFEAFHVLGHEKSMDASNFIFSARPETCRACGLCVKRCPMEALSLEGSPRAGNSKGLSPSLKGDLCIGCGVCAYKCPTRSLTLASRDEARDTPLDPRDYTNRFLAEKKAHAQGDR